jgi:hypothetical protein
MKVCRASGCSPSRHPQTIDQHGYVPSKRFAGLSVDGLPHSFFPSVFIRLAKPGRQQSGDDSGQSHDDPARKAPPRRCRYAHASRSKLGKPLATSDAKHHRGREGQQHQGSPQGQTGKGALKLLSVHDSDAPSDLRQPARVTGGLSAPSAGYGGLAENCAAIVEDQAALNQL